MRRCPRCQQDKPADQFYWNATRRVYGYCLACMRVRTRDQLRAMGPAAYRDNLMPTRAEMAELDHIRLC